MPNFKPKNTKKIIVNEKLNVSIDNKHENYLKEFLSLQKLKTEDLVRIINYETRNEYINSSLLNSLPS